MRFRLESGLALGYQTTGAGDVIVFLHPIGMNASFWRPVIDHLPPHFRALAIDAIGHGESDTPARALTLDNMAEDVVELMSAIGNGPCVMAGCSMGGMVAQGVALRAPELVRGLVLMNTAHTLPPQGRMVMEQRAADAAKGMPLILDTTIDRWFSPDFRAKSPDVVAQVKAHLLTCDPIVHGRAWHAIKDLDYESRLGAIRCPVLVISGSADVSTPPAVGQAMAKRFGLGAYKEISGAGHMAPLEHPKIIAEWIGEFASSLGGVKAS